MGKRTPRKPLTAAEIALAKRVNRYIGGRKTFALPSDRAGCEFTTKNVGDQCDQYIFEHDERIALSGEIVDRDQLVHILRRYRALKAAETRYKRKEARLRALSKRLNAIGDKLFREPGRLLRKARKEREAEAQKRQGALVL